MYYIINRDNQLIATDNDLLLLLKINNLQELFTKTASGKLSFKELNKETIEIASANHTVTLTQNRYPLSTVVGDLVLVEVSEAQKVSDNEIAFSSNTNNEDLVVFDTKPEKAPEENRESLFKLATEPEEEKEAGINLLADEEIKESLIKLVIEPKEEKETGINLLVNEDESLIKLVAEPEEEDETGINLLADEEIEESLPTDEEEEDALIKFVVEPEEKEEDVGINLIADEEEEDFIKLVTEPEEDEEEEEEEARINLITDEEEEDFIKLVTEPEEEKEIEINFLADEEEDFIKLVVEPEEEEARINLIADEEVEENFLIDDDEEEEEDFIKLVTEPEENKEEEVGNTINLLPDEKIDFSEPAKETIVQEDEDTLQPSDENIPIDIDKISKMLGISEEDYSSFLDEFIDKAIEEEASIKDINNSKHHDAITSLHNLSQMLHLTSFSAILERAEKASGEQREKAIELFYHNLTSLTAHPVKSEIVMPEPENIETEYENQICELILDDVRLIHFDFQPKQASEELGLPVDLIEEFVHDFIDQANEEKQTFIDACREGDIDTIHKTGHKLKGAASNLRIVPLADTLEEIQFCEDDTRLEPLFKKYWGQFLGLEQTMNNISYQQGGK